jgi:PAS domain S-box-containing protein
MKKPDSNTTPSFLTGRDWLLHFRVLPWLVLAGTLFMTHQMWQGEQQYSMEKLEAMFDARLNDHIAVLHERIEVYQTFLHGVGGLVNASDSVQRKEFHDYIEPAYLSIRYPGLSGVSFAPLLSNTAKDRHIAAVRRSGFPNYSIKPEGQRDFYTPVMYIEPLDRNLDALGYDTYSDPLRRAAMERARDSGKETITEKLTLVQSTDQKQKSILMFSPVYSSNKVPATLSERRASIAGWVAAPILLEEMLSSIFNMRYKDLDIEVFDSQDMTSESLLYDDDKILRAGNPQGALLTSSRRIEMGGRTWTLLFNSLPAFEEQLDTKKPQIVLVAGSITSLLLTLLTYLLINGRELAQRNARRMMREIEQSSVDAREQQVRIASILDTVADGIITINERGLVESFNVAATRIFDYLPDEVIGKNVSMLMPEPYHSAHDGYLSRFLEERTPRIIGLGREVVGRRKDGSTFPMDLAVSEAKFSDRHMFTGVVRDITELKRAEKELALSQQQSETIFDNNVVRVIDALARGDLTQKIVLGTQEATPRHRKISENLNTMVDQLNRFSEEVTRVAREVGTEGTLGGQAEVPGVAGTWKELTDNVNAMANNLTTQVRSISEVTRAVAKGDLTQEITVEVKGEVLALKDDINTMISTLATDRDIRDRAEAALVVAREAAEAGSRTKSDFLANMSHEIRTPMNAILGMSRLCLQTDLSDKQREYISKVDRSAQGLLGVINDILDFSKIDAGMLILEQAHFALKDSMALVDSSVGYLAKIKDLGFEASVAPDVPEYLVGDPLRLGQVLLNLASNAVKFTPVGRVKVSVALKEANEQSVELEFRVNDTGIGLSPAQAQGLFAAFSQVDTSTTRKFGGTGLGLAISKRLVELMGGRIWIESEVGVGSSFCFTARFGRGEASQAVLSGVVPELPASAMARLKGARILVVEDNEFNQDLIEELLEQWGAVVRLCGNGREALEQLAKERFDIVLMDVQMPVMDGYETTHQIRATPALAGQCVIAMTANAMATDRERCLEAGMDDFETKPINADHLYQTLLKWLPERSDAIEAVEAVEAVEAIEAIDLTILGQLLNNDPARIARFAQKFVNTSRAALTEMQTAYESGDLERLAGLCHKQKSAAASVGARSSTALYKALEAASKAGDRQQVQALLTRLPPLLEQVALQIERETG